MKVKYHEEFEKTIKGSKIEVVDDPESKRLKRLGSLVSQVEYKRSVDSDRHRRSSLTHEQRTSLTASCSYALLTRRYTLNFELLCVGSVHFTSVDNYAPAHSLTHSLTLLTVCVCVCDSE